MLEGVVPYPPEFAARYRQKGYWEDRSLTSIFDEIFSRFSERPALVSESRQISYGELAQHAERLALHLLKLGIQPLDRVVVQLPNVPEFVYLYFALQKIGAIPIMALPPHRHLEILQFVEMTGAVGYAISDKVGDFNFLELAAKIKQEFSSLRLVLVHGKEKPPGCFSLAQLLETDSGLSPDALGKISITPTDPAVFQLSGGTPGVR